MYGQASPFAPRHYRPGNVYTRVGLETEVYDASPHRLIALLFDGLLAALAQAEGAMQAGQREIKGHALGRAVRIVDEGLSAPLNLEEGGALAADLRNLYTYIAMRLTQANLHNDEAALDECVRLIEPLRAAWTQIGDRVPA